MDDDRSASDRVRRSPHGRALDREEVWDLFIDELDRCGQAGSAADVLTPSTLDPSVPSGKRFGDLTRADIDNLSKTAGNLGRRGDVVKMLWEQTQKQLKQQKRDAAKSPDDVDQPGP
jgi:hypothetical protein